MDHSGTPSIAKNILVTVDQEKTAELPSDEKCKHELFEFPW